MGYVNDEATANDMLQDCFLKVWQHLPTFRNEAGYNTWIYRIAVNTCLTYLKKDKKTGLDALVTDVPETDNRQQQLEEEIKLLYECIGMLKDADKLIISMVLEDMSYKDIGDTLGISENNIGVKVYRIKKQLMNLIDRNERF